MKKLNYKNLGLFIVMMIFTILFISDWLIVLFMGACFTWLGVITNMLFIFIAGAIYDYFEEYLEEKENRKKCK